MNYEHPYVMQKTALIPWGGLAKYVGIPAALLYGASQAWKMTQKSHNSMWDNQFMNEQGKSHIREGQTVYHDPEQWGGPAGTLRGYLEAYSPEEQESLYNKGVIRYRHDYDPPADMLSDMRNRQKYENLMEGRP